MTADVLLTVRSIGKVFGDQQVLADVSFEVVSGEILGLIGPNGAGKTTLLECIAGLLAADAGEVRWRGYVLPPARRKERLFYVPEAIAPYPDQKTAEVLKFFPGSPSPAAQPARAPAGRAGIGTRPGQARRHFVEGISAAISAGARAAGAAPRASDG
jgi:ABC-type multidrug transport system ATPase subunit